ncbi:ABC transporter substrate-binding protein [Vogesella sp. XCS3]|uniref:substrate-binding periplasmic protein n=1 Tax=Vogesella sp. XCS3 TaxID=2877939 RepID=UPI001D0A87A0|nr:transporter substrate-binding domain-containing protein [Vogesella sp. XCS3]UDM17580.1 transporter substrate-binding domain-containing protein [Vogesella sp. XCS3]
MKKALLATCVTVLILPAMAMAASIKAYTEALPPLNYEENGKVSGFASELLRQMASEAGHSVQLEVMPWMRAYRTVKQQPGSALYSIVRNPEREALFKWVGPIAPRRIMVYALASRPDVKIRRQPDLLRYRLGVLAESSAASQLLQLGLPEARLEYGQSDEVNLKKLLLGRADGVVMLDWAMRWQQKLQQVDAARIRPVWTLDQRYQYWFAFNKDTDPAMLRSLQHALDQLRADGRLAALKRRYGA